MDSTQIELVQRSWATIKLIGQQAGELFYQKLFIVAPDLLFSDNIQLQATKLVQMVSYVVDRLDKPEKLAGELIRLAARHRFIGAKPGHFIIVGQCLLATLQEVSGEEWNAAMKQAWVEAYTMVAEKIARPHQPVSY